MQKLKEIFVAHQLAGKTILCPELSRLYGGNLYFPKQNGLYPYIIGNFVLSVDGLTSYNLINKQDSSFVSKHNPQDRLIVSILRSVCDAVIVGEKTLNLEPGHLWVAEFMCPEYRYLFKKQRELLDKKEYPYNIFVTANGDINLEARIFCERDIKKIIVSTGYGYEVLKKNEHFNRINNTKIIVLKGDANNNIDIKKLVKILKVRFNINYLLVEGGPCLYGSFEKSKLVDELFLTISPIVLGNSYNNCRHTFSLSNCGYTPEDSPLTKILSIKTIGEYIFIRRQYIYRAK